MRWEIERDRFGLMSSRDIAVGECIEVVPAEDLDRLAEALRWMTDAGDAEDPLAWAIEAQARARAALEGTE